MEEVRAGSPQIRVEFAGQIALNVITPQIIDNLSRTLARASAENLRVSPRGGNSTADKFQPPLDVDLNIDLTQLNKIIEYEPANLTVTVEAGITMGALQKALAAHQQFLPLDPPQPSRATLGGIIATNSFGPLRLRYGTVRDWLIGARLVLVDGTVVRGGGKVVKNVAGYDLPKLLVGSYGTLGVVAEATFKLSPLPPVSRTLVATADAAGVLRHLLASLLRWTPLPNAAEMLAPGVAQSVYPEAPAGQYLFLAQVAGSLATVERQMRDGDTLCRDNGLIVAEALVDDAEQSVWARVRDLPAALGSPDTLVSEMRLLPSQLDEALREIPAIASRYEVECAAFTRAGQSVWFVLHGEAGAMPALVDEMRRWAGARRGYLVLQRLPVSLKGIVDVWGPTRTDFQIMQRLKAQFDPKDLLNRGMFVGDL
jgi:glycolate oxidase FAD binding subunit